MTGALPDDLASGLPVGRQRLGLWLAGLLLLGVLAFVVYSYVGTVVLGLFIYYVARPVYDRLEDYGPSRSLAALVALLVFIIPVLVLFAWTFALALEELVAFTQSQTVADYLALLQPYADLEVLSENLTTLVEGLLDGSVDPSELDFGETFSGVVDALVASVGVVGSVGLHLFVAAVIGFYLLRDDVRLVAWSRRTFVPAESVLESFFVAVDRDLKNIYFGNILNAFLTGVIAAVTYTVLDGVAPAGLGIPSPPLLGVLTGAASLVPVVGIKVTYVPVMLYLAVLAAIDDPSALWFPAVFGLVSVVVVDVIPDVVLRPYVSGRTVHVGSLMVAYVLGPLLFGWYGIFLGPLVLVVILEFGRVVVPWLTRPPGAAPEPPPEPAFAPPERAVEEPVADEAADEPDVPPDGVDPSAADEGPGDGSDADPSPED